MKSNVSTEISDMLPAVSLFCFNPFYFSFGACLKAVQSRHLEFLCTPLVVDYLRLKFSAGLPNPFRDTEWRREHRRMDRDLARFMLDEDESKLRVYILQGGCADSPRQA